MYFIHKCSAETYILNLPYESGKQRQRMKGLKKWKRKRMMIKQFCPKEQHGGKIGDCADGDGWIDKVTNT